MMSSPEFQTPPPPEVHEASDEDLRYLPAIEEASDTLFAEQGIDAFPLASGEEQPSDALQVLVTGNPPVGFAWLEEIGGNAHLEQLSVHPDAMGRGLGTGLLEASCRWAAEHGYPAITLTTFRDIPWNAPFYGRHGFEEITDPSEAILKVQRHEAELGLDKFGPRIAMIRKLG